MEQKRSASRSRTPGTRTPSGDGLESLERLTVGEPGREMELWCPKNDGLSVGFVYREVHTHMHA